MFEFITISNGVAVVQHGGTGHVYRFRPVNPGVWSSLTLDTIDPRPAPAQSPEIDEDEALLFAERTAPACCGIGEQATAPDGYSLLRQLFSLRKSRAGDGRTQTL